MAVSCCSAGLPHHSQRLPRGAKSTETGRRNSFWDIWYSPTSCWSDVTDQSVQVGHALLTSYLHGLRVDGTGPVVSGVGESTWNRLRCLRTEANEETLLPSNLSGSVYSRYNRYIYYSILFRGVLVIRLPGNRRRY